MDEVIAAGAGAGALVLAVSAVLKVADPDPTRQLLDALRSASSDPAATSWSAAARIGTGALAAGELLVAVAVLALGGRWSYAALALANVGFVAVLLAARHRAPGLSCGCFGRRSGPPDALQVVADLVVAAIAVAALVVDAPAVAEVAEDAPDRGAIVGAGALVLAACYAAVATRDAGQPLPPG